MGLSIVLEIVKHYGGTIIVKSEKGTGSTFQVTLPRTSL
jgi:signal transduction histidine kinase